MAKKKQKKGFAVMTREQVRRITSLGGQSRRVYPKDQESEAQIWAGMISRCYNIKDTSYHRYGGRGISVDSAWLKYENFFTDMGFRPSSKHSLDRTNNDLGYSKGNCRWATKLEQDNNRSTTVLLTFEGKTQSVSLWAEEKGIAYNTLSARIRERKWPVEKALTTPALNRKNPARFVRRDRSRTSAKNQDADKK